MLSDKDILIDEIDMNDIQLLITAVNESKLEADERVRVRKLLDRWQNALMITNKIRVTF